MTTTHISELMGDGVSSRLPSRLDRASGKAYQLQGRGSWSIAYDPETGHVTPVEEPPVGSIVLVRLDQDHGHLSATLAVGLGGQVTTDLTPGVPVEVVAPGRLFRLERPNVVAEVSILGPPGDHGDPRQEQLNILPAEPDPFVFLTGHRRAGETLTLESVRIWQLFESLVAKVTSRGLEWLDGRTRDATRTDNDPRLALAAKNGVPYSAHVQAQLRPLHDGGWVGLEAFSAWELAGSDGDFIISAVASDALARVQALRALPAHLRRATSAIHEIGRVGRRSTLLSQPELEALLEATARHATSPHADALFKAVAPEYIFEHHAPTAGLVGTNATLRTQVAIETARADAADAKASVATAENATLDAKCQDLEIKLHDTQVALEASRADTARLGRELDERRAEDLNSRRLECELEDLRALVEKLRGANKEGQRIIGSLYLEALEIAGACADEVLTVRALADRVKGHVQHGENISATNAMALLSATTEGLWAWANTASGLAARVSALAVAAPLAARDRWGELYVIRDALVPAPIKLEPGELGRAVGALRNPNVEEVTP